MYNGVYVLNKHIGASSATHLVYLYLEVTSKFVFRSLNDGECSADWYNFQESVAHLQLLEEEVVESHKNLVANMVHWAEQDASLLAMSNEVDYDQDGRIIIRISTLLC